MSSLDLLASRVFSRRPLLGDILRRDGEQSLIAYADQYRAHPRSVDPARKHECIAAITAETQSRLGDETAFRLAAQLERYYVVSTADHMGPLTHPFFVHANLLAGLAPYVSHDTAYTDVLVLACSNVSLNNSSFPRSLLFHDPSSGDRIDRLHFFPASERLMPVYRHGPFSADALTRMDQVLSRADRYPRAFVSAFQNLLQRVYRAPGVLEQTSFSRQVTISNALLWKAFFPSRDPLFPGLVYLDQEALVVRLLLEYHLDDATDLHAFLFDPTLHARIETLFDGIPGAFSRKEHKGTFLFWLLPPGHAHRIPLMRDGQTLVSSDGAYRIPLEPGAIRFLLERQELVPSIMLSLVTLACYYGLKCLGGFSQVNYLTWMEAAWQKLFERPLLSDDGFTSSLSSDLMIGFLKTPSSLVPATGIDFALYSDETSCARLSEAAHTLTVSEALHLMLPELYRILYAEHERDPILTAMTYQDIEGMLGIAGKIPFSLSSSHFLP